MLQQTLKTTVQRKSISLRILSLYLLQASDDSVKCKHNYIRIPSDNSQLLGYLVSQSVEHSVVRRQRTFFSHTHYKRNVSVSNSGQFGGSSTLKLQNTTSLSHPTKTRLTLTTDNQPTKTC